MVLQDECWVHQQKLINKGTFILGTHSTLATAVVKRLQIMFLKCYFYELSIYQLIDQLSTYQPINDAVNLSVSHNTLFPFQFFDTQSPVNSGP